MTPQELALRLCAISMPYERKLKIVQAIEPQITDDDSYDDYKAMRAEIVIWLDRGGYTANASDEQIIAEIKNLWGRRLGQIR